MENNIKPERVLAFSLATEIRPEEMEQVSGGTRGERTTHNSHENTMGGQDHNYDSNGD